jgi:hypothetical protein
MPKNIECNVNATEHKIANPCQIYYIIKSNVNK